MNEPIKDERLFLEECVAFIKVLDARARMILAAHEILEKRRRLVEPPADSVPELEELDAERKRAS